MYNLYDQDEQQEDEPFILRGLYKILCLPTINLQSEETKLGTKFDLQHEEMPSGRMLSVLERSAY